MVVLPLCVVIGMVDDGLDALLQLAEEAEHGVNTKPDSCADDDPLLSLVDAVCSNDSIAPARPGPASANAAAAQATQADAPKAQLCSTRAFTSATAGASNQRPSNHRPATSQASPGAAGPSQQHHVVQHFIETLTGLKIKLPRVSGIVLKERYRSVSCIPVRKSQYHTASEGSMWVVIGVLVSKQISTTSKGAPYSRWRVSDLAGSDASIFVFGEAHKDHYAEAEGSVLAFYNPKSNGKGTSSTSSSSGSLAVFQSAQIELLATSAGWGFCRGVTKAGARCSNAVDTTVSPYCQYHALQQAKTLRKPVRNNSSSKQATQEVMPQQPAASSGKVYDARTKTWHSSEPSTKPLVGSTAEAVKGSQQNPTRCASALNSGAGVRSSVSQPNNTATNKHFAHAGGNSNSPDIRGHPSMQDGAASLSPAATAQQVHVRETLKAKLKQQQQQLPTGASSAQRKPEAGHVGVHARQPSKARGSFDLLAVMSTVGGGATPAGQQQQAAPAPVRHARQQHHQQEHQQQMMRQPGRQQHHQQEQQQQQTTGQPGGQQHHQQEQHHFQQTVGQLGKQPTSTEYKHQQQQDQCISGNERADCPIDPRVSPEQPESPKAQQQTAVECAGLEALLHELFEESDDLADEGLAASATQASHNIDFMDVRQAIASEAAQGIAADGLHGCTQQHKGNQAAEGQNVQQQQQQHHNQQQQQGNRSSTPTVAWEGSSAAAEACAASAMARLSAHPASFSSSGCSSSGSSTAAKLHEAKQRMKVQLGLAKPGAAGSSARGSSRGQSGTGSKATAATGSNSRTAAHSKPHVSRIGAIGATAVGRPAPAGSVGQMQQRSNSTAPAGNAPPNSTHRAPMPPRAPAAPAAAAAVSRPAAPGCSSMGAACGNRGTAPASGFRAMFGRVLQRTDINKPDAKLLSAVDDAAHASMVSKLLDQYEQKDNLAQQLEAITKLEVTAFECRTCKFLTEKRRATCATHDVVPVRVTKRWWICEACGWRLHTLRELIPSKRCPKCRDPEKLFRPTSAYSGPKPTVGNASAPIACREAMLPRGREHAFSLNSLQDSAL